MSLLPVTLADLPFDALREIVTFVKFFDASEASYCPTAFALSLVNKAFYSISYKSSLVGFLISNAAFMGFKSQVEWLMAEFKSESKKSSYNSVHPYSCFASCLAGANYEIFEFFKAKFPSYPIEEKLLSDYRLWQPIGVQCSVTALLEMDRRFDIGNMSHKSYFIESVMENGCIEAVKFFLEDEHPLARKLFDTKTWEKPSNFNNFKPQIYHLERMLKNPHLKVNGSHLSFFNYLYEEKNFGFDKYRLPEIVAVRCDLPLLKKLGMLVPESIKQYPNFLYRVLQEAHRVEEADLIKMVKFLLEHGGQLDKYLYLAIESGSGALLDLFLDHRAYDPSRVHHQLLGVKDAKLRFRLLEKVGGDLEPSLYNEIWNASSSSPADDFKLGWKWLKGKGVPVSIGPLIERAMQNKASLFLLAEVEQISFQDLSSNAIPGLSSESTVFLVLFNNFREKKYLLPQYNSEEFHAVWAWLKANGARPNLDDFGWTVGEPADFRFYAQLESIHFEKSYGDQRPKCRFRTGVLYRLLVDYRKNKNNPIPGFYSDAEMEDIWDWIKMNGLTDLDEVLLSELPEEELFEVKGRSASVTGKRDMDIF